MLRNLVVVAGLWGLVNNAGVSLLAELEMTSEESLRQLFEVNFFGVVKVTRTLLPLLKKSRGRIVNMSSLTGAHRCKQDSNIRYVYHQLPVYVYFKKFLLQFRIN